MGMKQDQVFLLPITMLVLFIFICLSLGNMSFCKRVCLQKKSYTLQPADEHHIKTINKKFFLPQCFAETLRNCRNLHVIAIFAVLEQQHFTFTIFEQKHTVANPLILSFSDCVQYITIVCRYYSTGNIFREKRQSMQTGMKNTADLKTLNLEYIFPNLRTCD